MFWALWSIDICSSFPVMTVAAKPPQTVCLQVGMTLPLKLHLQRQVVGQVWPLDHCLLTSVLEGAKVFPLVVQVEVVDRVLWSRAGTRVRPVRPSLQPQNLREHQKALQSRDLTFSCKIFKKSKLIQKKKSFAQNNKQGQEEGGVSEVICGTHPAQIGDCPVWLTCPALWEERLVVLNAASKGTRWNAVLLGKGDTATRRKGKGCCLPNVLPWHEALNTYALFSHSLPPLPRTVINLKGRY